MYHHTNVFTSSPNGYYLTTSSTAYSRVAPKEKRFSHSLCITGFRAQYIPGAICS